MGFKGWKILISIIIPIYNVEKYLDRCICSVLTQTFRDLQVILVNDGSTDNSALICEKYKLADNRVIVVNKENGGLADARNVGMRYADGEYIAFVDGDDYVACDMYEELYNAIKRNSVPIACCGRAGFYEKGMKIRNRKSFVLKCEMVYDRIESVKALCLYNAMDFSCCDKLFEKSLFSGVRFPKGKTSEDIPVVFELFCRAKGVVHIGKAKYYYCHRMNSITGEPFSVRRMDYLFFIQNVCRKTLVLYPQCKKEVQVLHLRAAFSTWQNVMKLRDYKLQYSGIEKRLRIMIINLLIAYSFNPYIKLEEKKRMAGELLSGSVHLSDKKLTKKK